MAYNIIITGATGMVGEGVLLECLDDPRVSTVLSVSRRPTGRVHPKLKEYIVPDFLELGNEDKNLRGYDACFFCAGVSSVGMNEEKFSRNTFDTAISFAKSVLAQNPGMTFIYVSGAGTDSSEKGRLMWARVKGRTENELTAMPFKKVYNFRPGFMQLTPGQKNALKLYKLLGWTFPFFKLLFPNKTSTLKQVGQAMINSIDSGIDKNVLEVKDINKLGAG